MPEREGVLGADELQPNISARSSNVEQLTRTTILLAKVAIVFMPVSLATGYFSMQVQGIESVSLTTYWFTFMVVVMITVLFLGAFEYLSARRQAGLQVVD